MRGFSTAAYLYDPSRENRIPNPTACILSAAMMLRVF